MNYLQCALDSIHPDWHKFLAINLTTELSNIDKYLQDLSIDNVIFPPKSQIFRTLQFAPNEFKVVILGQDPYHGISEANGLAFAVNQDIKIPPSLRNIHKELVNEYELAKDYPFNRTLEPWLEQRVMLLNSSLTVIQDKANSLAHIGWQTVTDAIIQHISESSPVCVFMLWGNFARSKARLIDSQKHLVLESVHPSPLSASRGFFGCNHFQLANQFLASKNQETINWI